MCRILLVANDFPFPMNHGAAIDMWGQVQTLKSLNFKVDLVATVREMPRAEHITSVMRDVDHLWIVERQSGWRAALSIHPFQVKSRDGLSTVALSREYTVVILYAEHVASILQNQSLRFRKCVLRLHNDEARFFRELAKSAKSYFKKAFYLSEASKFRLFSPQMISKADSIWFISNYEKGEHIKRHPKDLKKSMFVPPLVDFNSMGSPSLKGTQVLFVGTLALENNASAVEWYVSEVHPLLRNISDYNFVIAGNTRGRSIQALIEIARPELEIFIHENPPNIESFYENAAVFVNPVHRGAGLKLKTIEAIRAGMPVVTTSIGIEGTGLEHEKHLLVADSAPAFADSVRLLLENKELAKQLVAAAQQFVAHEFNQQRIIRDSLAEILAGVDD